MILEGNERGYGADLARHLLNPRDNDHVTVHAVDGFVAEDLFGAFAEAEAISSATKCRNYLFSLSLNPPREASVDVDAFEAAIAAAEARRGRSGQPRAIVFHEKNGRRHAHCVWSRIDAQTLRAINIPHYKFKLGDISRDLYRTHGWDMPEGFRESARADPLNFSRVEAGQAKRTGHDPKAMKAMFRACWERTDTKSAFAAALHEEGFALARGDRRGFVAVDANGKTWSLSRWCGVRTAELRKKLGPEGDLPAVQDAIAPAPKRRAAATTAHRAQRAMLVARQRNERADLLAAQAARRIAYLRARRDRLPRWLKSAFLKVTGGYDAWRRRAEAETAQAQKRNRDEQQRLIETHLAERRALDQDRPRADLSETARERFAPDPRQALVPRPDEVSFTRDQLLRDPAVILDAISKTKAAFTRTDVLRALAKHIDDPLELQTAAERALTSPDLIRIAEHQDLFTTRSYRKAEEALSETIAAMHATDGFAVDASHRRAAIQTQDRALHQAFGGHLSAEQRDAIAHVLGAGQVCSVVGLAGAGKSTMLAGAAEAWRRQGVTVHGAALAGKAADGLEEASGIASRTLASLEASWKSGYAPIARGDVLVVDEAGMVGTRQLGRLAAKLQAIGAKLVLVGDPDQLQPIEAGAPFREIIATHGGATLSEIRRQTADWQKQASQDLAAGRVAAAVETYARHGAVARGRKTDDALEALVETYAMDAAADPKGASRLALAHRRQDVHALNQAIRAALRPADTASEDELLETETGTRAFAPGDRIVLGRNDRDLGVKNGMLGTVRAISPSKVTVEIDGQGGRRVTFDPHVYRAFDHGYAITIHKSQGATVSQAYVLASRSMDRHLAYVAMTRHRDGLRLFLSETGRPAWLSDQEGRLRPRQRAGPSLG
ncbi:MAG: AAA family ATPase [Pseudomonadota bacterium]